MALIRGDMRDNALYGTSEADTLIGEFGNDLLQGGGGHDEFLGGAGIDTIAYGDSPEGVHANLSIRRFFGGTANGDKLLDAIENVHGSNYHDQLGGDWQVNELRGLGGNDTLAGEEGADKLYGDGGQDTLKGGGGDDLLAGGQDEDTLDGGVGNDTMRGGAGVDAYYVDSAGDMVIDGVGEGTGDNVFASVSYALASGAQIEFLSTGFDAGTGAINLTGNEFANTISGNLGANRLDGGGGADILVGLGGDDFFFVDDAGDMVIEGAGWGTGDRVFASASYTLTAGAAIETFSTTDHAGTGAIRLGGNELANTIYANAGANVLDGGLGADTMLGLQGSDFYYVDNPADYIYENLGEGEDNAHTSVSYTLPRGREIEVLQCDAGGTGTLVLYGNEFNNTIKGNAGSNYLAGLNGTDFLLGRAGADYFIFNASIGAGSGVDTILDFSHAQADMIGLHSGVFKALSAGALAPARFRIAPAAADADDRIIYNSVTGSLAYDPDGTGAAAQIQFATLLGAPALTAEDFYIV